MSLAPFFVLGRFSRTYMYTMLTQFHKRYQGLHNSNSPLQMAGLGRLLPKLLVIRIRYQLRASTLPFGPIPMPDLRVGTASFRICHFRQCARQPVEEHFESLMIITNFDMPRDGRVKILRWAQFQIVPSIIAIISETPVIISLGFSAGVACMLPPLLLTWIKPDVQKTITTIILTNS